MSCRQEGVPCRVFIGVNYGGEGPSSTFLVGGSVNYGGGGSSSTFPSAEELKAAQRVFRKPRRCRFCR